MNVFSDFQVLVFVSFLFLLPLKKRKRDRPHPAWVKVHVSPLGDSSETFETVSAGVLLYLRRITKITDILPLLFALMCTQHDIVHFSFTCWSGFSSEGVSAQLPYAVSPERSQSTSLPGIGSRGHPSHKHSYHNHPHKQLSQRFLSSGHERIHLFVF